MASNQEINNARFDKEAATWDTNSKHVEGVEKAFEAIKQHVPAFQDGSSKSTSSPSPLHSLCPTHPFPYISKNPPNTRPRYRNRC